MWELTEYDQERKPQEIIMNSDISVSPKCLQRELMCPICLDVLTETLTTRDCLHRFCSSCINKALRSGNKECPTCRKKLASKRALRADPNFDQLIAKIYPNREDIDKKEDAKTLKTPESTPNCEIILRHLNGQNVKGTRFIKCSNDTTIGHLSKYLAIRPERSSLPEVDKQSTYRLAVVADRSRGHYELLTDGTRLKDINRENPIELYYFLE